VRAAADLAGVVRSRDLEEEELSLAPEEPGSGGDGGARRRGGRVDDLERDADREFAQTKVRAQDARRRELHQGHHPGRREHGREGVRGLEADGTGEIGGPQLAHGGPE